MIYLLCHPTARVFFSILNNFHFILKKNGIDSTIVHQIDQNDDLWFVIWTGLENEILPKKCIIYNMEPMVDFLFKQLSEMINRSKHSSITIVNYCYGKTFDRLKTLNYPCFVMPYGYSEYHKTIQATQNDNIDILFYGNISPRRQQVLQQVYEFSVKNGYKLKIYNNNLYDEHNRTREIINSKIIISIASDDAKSSETNDLARSGQILSLGRFLITEYIGDTVVESKMNKYVPHFSTAKELVDLLDFYLTHEEDRLKMIEHSQFKTDFDLEKSFLTFLNIK